MMSLLSRALVKAPGVQRLPQVASTGGMIFNNASLPMGPQGQISMMQTYGQVGWLYATVSRIAQATASATWRLYQRNDQGEEREIFKHPALDVWNTANPFETGESFREAGQQHQELVGEWWTVLLRDGSGQVVELQLVRPDRMTVVPDPDNVIAGYIYRVGAEMIPLNTEDVILQKLPSPLDPYRGMGPVQSLLADLDSERFAARWTRSFFFNSAEPGGVIEYEDSLSDMDWERITKRWEEQHKGINNAHRVAVIERGQWKDRTMTMRNMQFVDLRKLTMDLVVGAFGMPKALLGVSESVNRANAEAAEVMFGRWVIKPRLDRTKAMLNSQFLPNFDDTGTLAFDYDNPVPDDRTIDLAEATQGYSMGVLTLNEARDRLDEPMVDGGDEFKPQGGGLFDFGGGTESARSWKGWTKADDPLLPSSVEREERRVAQNWHRRLKAEMEAIALHCREFMARRVKIELTDLNTYDWDWWSKYSDEVIEELTSLVSMSITAGFPEVEVIRVQQLAAAYAKQRGAQLLRLDGELSMVRFTRDRVNTLVSQAINEGQGLGQLRRALTDDVAFSPQRAAMVARTETAFALGQGQKSAAIEQGRDQKHWVTQGDVHVDDKICRMNEGKGWIKLGDPFPSGHDTVPAHPNCRCVVRYRTSGGASIDPLEDVGDDVAAAIAGSRGIISQVECPKCHNTLPIRNFRGAAEGYCRKCSLSFPLVTDMHETERKMVLRDGDGRISDVRTFNGNGRH